MHARALGLALLTVTVGCADRGGGDVAADGGGDSGDALVCHGSRPDDPVQCVAGSTCCYRSAAESSFAFCCEPGTQCCVMWQYSGFASEYLESTCYPRDTPCPVFCRGNTSPSTCPQGQWCLNTGGCTVRCDGDECYQGLCCAPGYYCGPPETYAPPSCWLKADAGVDAIAD